MNNYDGYILVSISNIKKNTNIERGSTMLSSWRGLRGC